MESFNARRHNELVEDNSFTRCARPGRHRRLAAPLQYNQATQTVGYKPTDGELFVLASFPAALRRPLRRHAPTAAAADTKLTFCQDHSGSIS